MSNLLLIQRLGLSFITRPAGSVKGHEMTNYAKNSLARKELFRLLHVLHHASRAKIQLD